MTDPKLFYFSPDTAHVYLGGGNPAVIFPVAPMTRVRFMLDILRLRLIQAISPTAENRLHGSTTGHTSAILHIEE
jgi:hypothetical protein